MPDTPYVIVPSRTVTRYMLKNLTPDERREVLRLWGYIQTDPSPDERVKITYFEIGEMYTLYVGPKWWILYHVDGIRVLISGITRGKKYAD